MTYIKSLTDTWTWLINADGQKTTYMEMPTKVVLKNDDESKLADAETIVRDLIDYVRKEYENFDKINSLEPPQKRNRK